MTIKKGPCEVCGKSARKSNNDIPGAVRLCKECFEMPRHSARKAELGSLSALPNSLIQNQRGRRRRGGGRSYPSAGGGSG